MDCRKYGLQVSGGCRIGFMLSMGAAFLQSRASSESGLELALLPLMDLLNHNSSNLVRLCAAALLCCAVLCCAVLCCAVLCCAVLCCAVLCCAVLCCAVLCCAVLCCAVPRCAEDSARALCLTFLAKLMCISGCCTWWLCYMQGDLQASHFSSSLKLVSGPHAFEPGQEVKPCPALPCPTQLLDVKLGALYDLPQISWSTTMDQMMTPTVVSAGHTFLW